MIPIEHIQFAAITLTGALTMLLVFMLPLHASVGHVFNRSRWLMAMGTALLPIQFLLQYTLHFRRMGVSQAVLINLLFFVPCAWLISLGLINLLRQGVLRRTDLLVGFVCFSTIAALLLGVNPLFGHKILEGTKELYTVEVICAVIFTIMQFHYSGQLWRGFKRVHMALENYYDRERDGVVRWMRNSGTLLALSGVFAPMVIFREGALLNVYAGIIFSAIGYTVISFYGYGLDRRRQQTLQEIEKSVQEEEEEAAEAESKKENRETDKKETQRINTIVKKWLDNGGHLHSGITIQTAAEEMHLPRYQLSAWLKNTQHELFNPWLSHHRIEEAKRLLAEHPEWSNDIIAERCGFASRSYFQNIFKKQTGMTPAQFLQQVAR